MEDTLTPGLGGFVSSRMDASDLLALCLDAVTHEVKDDVLLGKEITVMRFSVCFKIMFNLLPKLE